MPQREIANCHSILPVDIQTHAAKCNWNRARIARGAASRLTTLTLQSAIAFALAFLAATGTTLAQDVVMESPPGMDNGAMPMTQYGEGGFFSQSLGTPLRLSYRTESYGQPGRGNFDFGTMQVWSLDGSAAFFDGQITLNELQGVGYNLGVGYRWLGPGMGDGGGRMGGISLWTDGTSTDSGNFFPQIGLSLESLGDMWDVRANGYLALGPQSQTGEFTPTGLTGFQGNSISELTQAVVNTSYSVAELEGARRLGSQRDAWAFAGPYFVGNDDDDAVGYRLGVRGYAYPDLLLQFAVSDDEIFKTNATFSVTWFVGRTRTDFQPTCGVPDRIREPVMRNDYVALAESFVTGGIPLTKPDGSALRFVHVDSDAGAGGDGTFENPFNNLTDVNGAGSLEGDVILAHALSVFDSEGSVELKDTQRLLGEGNSVEHTVATQQRGVIIIPETFAGARTATRPSLLGPALGGDAIVLANGNEVNNFTIDGEGATVRAIASPGNGSGNPILRNLNISNTVGDGIALTPLSEVDSDDSDNDGNVTETFVRGNVTIANVTFNNIGQDDIDINAFTNTNILLPTVTLQETISIADISSTSNNGRSIAIANTHAIAAGRTVTINNFTYDGGGDSLGGIVLTNFDSTFNATNSTLTGGNITGAGAQILGDSDGAITFANTVLFNDLAGTAVDINGDDTGTDALGGTINVNGTITNGTILDPGTGRSVRIRNMATGAVVNFAATADITHVTSGANAEGVLISDNSGGTVTFSGDLDLRTTGSIAFDMSEVGADVTLTAPSANNSINTTNAIGLRIVGANIGTTGVTFPEFNASGGTNGIFLADNTGGAINVGLLANDPGETGVIAATGDAIVIDNSANVVISGVRINNAATFSGVLVTKDTAGSQTTNLNNLEINGGAFGVNVDGNALGTLTLTVNDSDINNSTNAGFFMDDIDGGNVQINNTTFDGDGTTANADGIRIANSNVQTTIDIDPTNDNTVIQNFDGDEFEVDGGSPNVTMNGSIVNSDGRSVYVHNVAGGTVTFSNNSSIDDNAGGLLAETNSAGVISFLGTNDFDTTTNDAVTVRNNTGTVDFIFEDLDINTTSGDGVVVLNNQSTTSVVITGVDVTTTLAGGDAFRAVGGGDLTVSGANNVITTAQGVGLRIDGMNIATQALFESVTVNGAPNAIVLNNVTGSQITIGEVGGAADSGGTLTTIGDAVQLTNVANVDFNNVQVASAGGHGFNITHDNATVMDVTINDTDIDSTTLDGIATANTGSGVFNLNVNRTDVTNAGSESFNFAASGAANDTNVRIDGFTAQDNVVVTATNSAALDFRMDNSNIDANTTLTLNSTGQIDLLFEDSEFDANTGVAFQLDFGSATTDVDAIFRSNDGGAGFTSDDNSAFVMTATGTNAEIDIQFDANNFTTNGGANATMDVAVTGGANVETTITNNTFNRTGGTVVLDMTATGSTGGGENLINLDLRNNTANPGTGDYVLTTTGAGVPTVDFNFGVVDRDDADANNAGDVIFTPNINEFEDITSVTLPVLP